MTANGKIDRGSLPLPVRGTSLPPKIEPLSGTARRLADIWQDLLKLPSVRMQDNFFDLGGHSLLVPLLLQRISAAFHEHISMAAIFYAPTLEQQVALIERTAELDMGAPGLIPLQPKGHLPALFWLDPPSPIVNLTKALGDNRPVLGVVLSPADIRAVEDAPSIERIAARHVQTILKAQASGPYFLSGFCTGGIVAFETAIQLQQAGHEVGLLILVDAQNPVFYKRVDSLAVEMSKIWFYLKQVFKQGGTLKQFYLRLRSRFIKITKPELLKIEMYGTDSMTESAAYRYKPTDYSGSVLFLQPEDHPARENHVPGWAATVSGRLEVQNIPGNHEQLFRQPCVRTMADIIACYLGRAGGENI